MKTYFRNSKLFVATATLAAACLPLAATSGVAQTNVDSGQTGHTIVYSANAYGTYAFVGNVVNVGKTAVVSLGSPCGTPQVGAHRTGTIASVTAPPLVLSGLVDTSATSAANSSTATADILQFNLLAGLISGSEVKAVSTTTISNGALQSNATGSHFVNLVVLGSHISSTPAANTTITLPGIGRVVLNEQIRSSTANSARLTVNMVHVYITAANLLGFKVGTQIILADAVSGITDIDGPAALDGFAYGTSVNAHLLQSSPTAYAGLGCDGTEDGVITRTAVGVNVPTVLSSATITDTAKGDADIGLAEGQTTTKIQSVNVLSSLVRADLIQAQANASTTNGSTFNFSSSGSFVNLSVAGHPAINASVAPNTSVSLAGLGTLYLHRVLKNNNSIEVRMIELIVNQSNTLGLPLGADIRVGVAEASLHSLTHP